MAIDTLIIGHNDGMFADEVKATRAMHREHPNYRDLNLNFIEYGGVPYRAMDILDHFHYEGRATPDRRRFHNAEVLWMVVMYLGTYLSRRGYTFDYVNLFQLQKDELAEKLRRNEYLTTVVTTTIYNYDSPILEVVRFVREHNPRTKIIVGGPYIAKRSETMEPPDLEAMFKYLGADVYVRSREGEQALVNILAALKAGRSLSSIKNIAYHDNGRFVLNGVEPEFNSLHENLIDYRLFPKEQIGSYVNVRITKGCPFACAFCSFPLRTEKYNVSRVDYIERELEAIHGVGTVSGLFFVDDTLNVPLATFKDMLRMMIRRNFGFRWHCFFRADFCDEEMVDLMARAGCQGVFLGVESANDAILQAMNKTPRKHDYLRVIPMFKAAGIKVFASLFFGFPGETHATARETIDFLAEIRPDFYRPLVWYCDPVTPIWQQRKKYALNGFHFGWSHRSMNVAEACDLVEKCFLTFDEPLWVPDPGFNFVSLFLLQERGMTFPQITTFLKAFNAVVKEKLFDPDRTDPSPELMTSLRRACQYDRADPSEAPVPEVLSAARYAESEAFWVRELADPVVTAPLDSVAGDGRGTWQRGALRRVDGIDALLLHPMVNASTVILTAYAIVLWRSGAPLDPLIVVADDEGPAFPVRVLLSPGQRFADAVRETGRRVDDAARHRSVVRRILSAGVRAPGHTKPSVALRGACWTTTADGPDAASAEALERRFPADAYGSLDSVLAADHRGGAVVLRTYSRAATIDRDVLGRQTAAVASVLETALPHPDLVLDEIDVPELAPADTVLDQQERVQFLF